MGVNSLWTIIGPAARPVRLEALSRKKLAVDASIWIYQFLKAVRDEEGNAISQSHIVGFFRRICKLLYYGILPIFVFDGGAPVLKRRVLRERQERRKQGEREETSQKAQKLLARQIQRYADKDQSSGAKDDILQDRNEKEASKNVFRRKDEYHLPDIESFKVSTRDGRIMKNEDLNEIKEDFDYVDGVDINSVDPGSKEFADLPTATQYMILSHLRIRSRLRMGYDKDQLDAIFPNRMEFSKFQIQQVQKRNFYTQRLMDVSGMGDNGNTDRRIAGDKDRRYALVKNDDGWTLSLGDGDSSFEKPIVLEDEVNFATKYSKNEGNTLNKNHFSNEEKISEPVEVKDDIGDQGEENEDDDVEWEDVSIQEETEEEKQIQRAIIDSIYSKYQYEESMQNVENPSLSLVEEINSKTTHSEKTKENNAQKAFSSSVMPELSSINFGTSFLFESKSSSQNVKLEAPSVKVNLTETDKSSHLQDTKVVSETLSTTNKVQDEVIDNSGEFQANKINDDRTPENKGKVQNSLPTWFNDSITLNQNSYKEATDNKSIKASRDKYDEDEDAGLISWNEAQSYINTNENEFTVDDGIQEVDWNGDEVNTSVKEIQMSDNSFDGDNDVIEIPPIQEEKEDVEPDDENVQNTVRQERKPAFIEYDFEKDEESQLVQQLADEELDHEEFKSEMRSNFNKPEEFSSTSVTEDQLLQEKLKKAKRDSDEVTENMILDIQELLKRFGIPYITAPMEAEAQCAELLKLKLVDGIVTDDSDCFLFGGDKIYKNMFQQKQFVECYMKNDIEEKLGLNQDSLIELAQLLGSDYTEGIKGIGPVLAMEILAEFGDLKSFKHWFDENTKTTKALDRNDISSLKKNLLTKVKKGKLFLQNSFPDNVIYDAYKFPEVDHDKSEFKWGFPNLDQIRTFLMYNVNWNQQKVDEILIPLIQDMNKKKSEGIQPRISEFFPQTYISDKKELAVGKRLKTASNKLHKRKRA